MAATASALGRAYFCSDLRFSWPLLAISRGRLTPASARCVRAEWRSWCSVHAQDLLRGVSDADTADIGVKVRRSPGRPSRQRSRSAPASIFVLVDGLVMIIASIFGKARGLIALIGIVVVLRGIILIAAGWQLRKLNNELGAAARLTAPGHSDSSTLDESPTGCSPPATAARSAATPSSGCSPSTPRSPERSRPSLKGKRRSPHALRHTTAMRLLHASVNTTVIALWLGHERRARRRSTSTPTSPSRSECSPAPRHHTRARVATEPPTRCWPSCGACYADTPARSPASQQEKPRR
jgi:hypothetical protein